VNATQLINVVDIEATCWANDVEKPAGQLSEIIEVGVCTLDVATLSVQEPRGILTFPIDSEVSLFCTKLTTLTADKIRAEGVELGAACLYLREFRKSREHIWASYGDYDRRMFAENCKRREIPYPFGARHWNVKSMAAVAFGWPAEVDMAVALARMGLELEGTHHRGVDDAANTARILAELIRGMRGAI
jgi:inhibitor of KinA sporulation pathway (predicted exonuclease)